MQAAERALSAAVNAVGPAAVAEVLPDEYAVVEHRWQAMKAETRPFWPQACARLRAAAEAMQAAAERLQDGGTDLVAQGTLQDGY